MDQEDTLLRMSFLEHLEELRTRLIRALLGFGVIFLACLAFSDRLWLISSCPTSTPDAPSEGGPLATFC